MGHEDAEEYERAHDEALLAEAEIADPAPTLVMEVSEDDPDEDPSEPETETVPSDDGTPEPEDTPDDSTDAPPPVPEMMRVDAHHWITGRLMDQLAAAQTRVTELQNETGIASLMDRLAAAQARVTELVEELEAETEAATPERAPTPYPAPRSPTPTETDDMMDPILDGVTATPVDPPPPPPLPVVALAYHDWVVSRYATDLTTAEAQVTELRYQLSAERQMRIGAQGGRVDTSTRRMRRTMRRIEQRTIGRIRRLSPLRGPVSRRAVIQVVTSAMRRVREATRISEL